jgi:SAM-dependent methyltransferase
MTTELTDTQNRQFWDELCGTTFARKLGIHDHSPASLQRFDQAYFDYYPYLLKHISPERMIGRRVLEIGLGYGTLGQHIAESGAAYTGLDLALGPVEMMRYRLGILGIPGRAVCGNSLSLPLAEGEFDFVVSIGCLHHTGDVQRCLNQIYRVLRPGGSAIVMLYNQFSYKQWITWPKPTFQALRRDLGMFKGQIVYSADQRRVFDSNLAGEEAPETVFLSIHQLRNMLKQFSGVRFHKENCDANFWGGNMFGMRKRLLPYLGRSMGLDIYFEAVK